MAAITLIEINTNQLSNDIRQLRTTLNRTRGHIDHLHTSMEAMNNMWAGPANAVMRQRFRDDHETLLSLCSMLEELIQTLESIREAYDNCEDRVHSAVDALHI